MKKVYLLVKESYIYWDNDYDTTFNVFFDKQSAMNYLAVMKEMLLDEAIQELNVTSVKEIEALAEEEDRVYDYSNSDDYYHIDIEEWGHDYLYIVEKDVMEFHLNEEEEQQYADGSC